MGDQNSTGARKKWSHLCRVTVAAHCESQWFSTHVSINWTAPLCSLSLPLAHKTTAVRKPTFFPSPIKQGLEENHFKQWKSPGCCMNTEENSKGEPCGVGEVTCEFSPFFCFSFLLNVCAFCLLVDIYSWTNIFVYEWLPPGRVSHFPYRFPDPPEKSII